MLITKEIGIYHRKLVGYWFRLLQIHICFEYVICMWACWKAAGGQIGGGGGDGLQKWKIQGEWVQK